MEGTLEPRTGFLACPYGCFPAQIRVQGGVGTGHKLTEALGAKSWDASGATVQHRKVVDPNTHILLATCGKHWFEVEFTDITYRMAEPPDDDL